MNDCVIIPEFGGFVLQTHPANLLLSEHNFQPSYKELVFNHSLTHDDGLLTRSYMQMYGIDEENAHDWLNNDVAELKKELDESTCLPIGKLGEFQKRDDGILFVLADHKVLVNLNFYGLAPFHIPPVFQKATEDKAQNKNSQQKPVKRKRTVNLPINKGLLGITAASVAAILLFLLITRPIEEVSSRLYTASFIPSNLTSNHLDDIPSQSLEPVVEGETIVPSDTVTKVSVDEVVETTTQAIEEKATQAKKYYIIIGSFYSEKQANQFILETDTSPCDEIGIVKHGEHIRVYGAVFTNRADAENRMKSLRQTEIFKHAWLFIQR